MKILKDQSLSNPQGLINNDLSIQVCGMWAQL